MSIYSAKHPVPEDGYGGWVEAEIRRIEASMPDARDLYVSISYTHGPKPEGKSVQVDTGRTGPTCSTCLYHARPLNPHGVAQCRRNPPKPGVGWQYTSPSDWCGAHFPAGAGW